MSKKHTIKSSNYNDIGLRLMNKMFGIQHLHYGYFDKGLKVEISNVSRAQDRYVEKLLSLIPKSVNTIFDVGCGTGGISSKLLEKKKKVYSVAPDPYLTNMTTRKTKGKAKVFTDLYENITTGQVAESSIDLILMSESCQYIKQIEGWKQNYLFLKDKGYVLIADFFKIKKIDRPDISKSGHDIKDFIKIAESTGFKLKKKLDITRQTAPTMKIYQGIIIDYVFPVVEAIFEVFERRFRWTYKILKKIFGKKIGKLHAKYSTQDPKTFSKYKGYFILLFQKN